MTEVFKVGDRVSNIDGDEGVVLAVHEPYAWVLLDDYNEPEHDAVRNFTLIPPAPVACLWRNVSPWRLSTHYHSREAADACAASDRLGVVVGYSDGTYKLEVVDQ